MASLKPEHVCRTGSEKISLCNTAVQTMCWNTTGKAEHIIIILETFGT
jgi:hypothetical protein